MQVCKRQVAGVDPNKTVEPVDPDHPSTLTTGRARRSQHVGGRPGSGGLGTGCCSCGLRRPPPAPQHLPEVDAIVAPQAHREAAAWRAGCAAPAGLPACRRSARRVVSPNDGAQASGQGAGARHRCRRPEASASPASVLARRSTQGEASGARRDLQHTCGGAPLPATHPIPHARVPSALPSLCRWGAQAVPSTPGGARRGGGRTRRWSRATHFTTLTILTEVSRYCVSSP